MQDENLGESLTESYRTHKRTVAVRNLGERTHLTLEQIAKLVSHAEHGDIVKDITLQELLDVTTAPESEEGDDESEEEETAAASPTKRRGPKKKAKKAAKKAAKKKAKKAAKKTTSRSGRKADYGKKKPRLDYEQGCKEILAALKAHGEPAARGDLEDATGYSGVQVRTFCKRLAENGKIEILGKGGRSTRYGLS